MSFHVLISAITTCRCRTRYIPTCSYCNYYCSLRLPLIPPSPSSMLKVPNNSSGLKTDHLGGQYGECKAEHCCRQRVNKVKWGYKISLSSLNRKLGATRDCLLTEKAVCKNIFLAGKEKHFYLLRCVKTILHCLLIYKYNENMIYKCRKLNCSFNNSAFTSTGKKIMFEFKAVNWTLREFIFWAIS